MKPSTTHEAVDQDTTRRRVQDAYGTIARRAGTGEACGCGPACCSSDADIVPEERAGTVDLRARARALGYSADELAAVPEGANLGLGCGNPGALAALRPGQVVLDLGSGAGFDAFLAARAVGPTGRVVGVDMTPDMISRARANAARGGYEQVEFRLGEIESLPVADATIDVILSNCVINLSPDKPRVYREAMRVLKPGGTLAVSDIVALRPMPEALRADFAAYTGCVAGASLVSEVEQMLREAGFVDVRVEVKESSRAFINEIKPDAQPGDYVASASITARKPVG